MDMDTIESNRTISDDQAKKMMAEFAHCSNISDFQRLEDAEQRQVIREMYEQRMSIRQISRLTGRSRLFITKLVGADPKSKEALYQKLIDEAGENQFLLHENVPW
jgi:DNA invertase Pin-like site-specific DNA recombinase